MSLSSKPHRTVPANTRRTAKAAFKIGEDGDTLLKCLASSEVATEGQALDSVQTLAGL